MQLYSYNGQVTHYQITETGELFNTKTQKWLKGSINALGYLVYRISFNGISKDLYAHRMVAETYIINSNPLQNCVNHKDGNKQNNSVLNLEWVTKGDNNRHARDTLLNPLFQEVYCFDKNKNLIAHYPSIQAAAQIINGTADVIGRAARATDKNLHYGYYWNVINDNSFNTVVKTSGGTKPVARYSLDGVLLETYESITEASRLTHLPRARISECAYGNISTYGGYIWKFLNKI